MASREEEKRLRREEREKAEAAAAASAGRAKRLQFLGGALLAIAAVVVVVLLVTGGNDKSSSNAAQPASAKETAASIPAPVERDLAKAAKAAGCELLDPPLEGSTHVEGKVKYKTNPPTSGNHSAEAALDGIYDVGQQPAPENSVHALEHGRIDFQYKPGTPKKLVAQLETLVSEPLNGKDGYKALLFQNDTGMPYAVAATAWGHLIGCKKASDAMFDALRDFRVKYVDKGPEPGIPPTN